MKSDATLHILHQFQTYQQTTEYTCGAASALMVLNWFGQKQYHEKAIAGLLEVHCTNGSFADPYDVTDHKQDGYYTYPLRRFFGMWREGPCAGKAEPYQQPFVATWPKV